MRNMRTNDMNERIELLKKALEVARSKGAFCKEALFSVAHSPNTARITAMLEGKRKITDRTLQLILRYLRKHETDEL